MKKVLITGAGSYIGTSVEAYLNRHEFVGMYRVDTVDVIGDAWKEKDFSMYDTVFHVAGIVHQKESKENAFLYYKVNRDLTLEIAKKAKMEGVKQFIFLSSMSVYGIERGTIRKDTSPNPKSHYGKSKLQAEKGLIQLQNETFLIAIMRPPMIYGEGCKGNYQLLKKIAMNIPLFPDYPNQRSMLSIENCSEFVRLLIEKQKDGLFFPQDPEYVKTAEMVKKIAEQNGKKIHLIKGFNWGIKLLCCMPGKIGQLTKKAFESLVYEKDINDLKIRCEI